MKNEFSKILIIVIIVAIISSFFGGMAGFFVSNYEQRQKTPQISEQKKEEKESTLVKVQEESAVILSVEKVSPAVVSIIVSKDLPIIEKYYSSGSGFWGSLFATPHYRQRGMERKEIGGGSGFLVSSDGYIVTNKHVVADEDANYTVLLNDESKYEAKVLARDSITDLAVLKIDRDNDFDFVELGDSDGLKVGQTVIAIGNALAEFRNTVSTGVVSGLARSITAGGGVMGSENLMGLIQTDASINPGNSGGPLLNLAGQVIGINTAMASGAENIGFAIPINEVKNTIENVQKNGRLVRPWLGVRYMMLNEQVAKLANLGISDGALIVSGNNDELAVIPNSPADKAGLKEGDVILRVGNTKISEDNPLFKIISSYQVGDEIKMTILRDKQEKVVKLKLEEMN